MNSLSLRLRHVVILSCTIAALSLPLHANQPNVTIKDEKKCQLLDALVHNWHTLEDAISNNFNNLINIFENLFQEKPYTKPIFNYDATLVGFVNSGDGIGNHPILFKKCLGNTIKLNFASTRNIPTDIEDAQLGLPRLDPARPQDIGAVSILTDILADKALNLHEKVPNSIIKIAYTMFESTEIPYNWATILNKKFDMAVVPDQFLVEVYKKSGVQIPIFVLPLPLLLHDFLTLQKHKSCKKPFVFGLSGGFWERKNHMRALEAFAEEFGNNPDVMLRIHGRFGEPEIINALANKIIEYNLSNVELIVKPYTRAEYLEFFSSLDCYVFLSKGEGFSITPREALACATPCILTNNTAQITICSSGAVRVVPSNILVPAFYDCHYDGSYGYNYIDSLIQKNSMLNGQKSIDLDIDDLISRSGYVGYQFDCSVKDARKAMRSVYKNYAYYLKKAQIGKEWVKHYLPENLSSKYISLVKPESVHLGEENIIGDTFLITTSKELHAKYQYILGK